MYREQFDPSIDRVLKFFKNTMTFSFGMLAAFMVQDAIDAFRPEPMPVIYNYPPLVTGAVFDEVENEPQKIDLQFDILSDSGYTKSDLTRMLDSNTHRDLLPYVDAIIEAEETYGVNALYLTCKLGLESGWGKYECGTYNIAGWKNNDGSYRNFSSPEECVMTIAKSLSTTYKETVGSSLGAVCTRYSTNPNYSYTLMSIMEEMQHGYQML